MVCSLEEPGREGCGGRVLPAVPLASAGFEPEGFEGPFLVGRLWLGLLMMNAFVVVYGWRY